jgi:hypothetical protein
MPDVCFVDVLVVLCVVVLSVEDDVKINISTVAQR